MSAYSGVDGAKPLKQSNKMSCRSVVISVENVMCDSSDLILVIC